uniref:Mid2 domain-containing protein n=1 Tax=Candidozyma auris TaxID=498019 RepID=A0A0L0NXQ6_CANAR
MTSFTSGSSHYAGYYSTVSVLPDTTITTLVAVPTTPSNGDSGGGTAQRNAKLIGGLVGSIGGTILIGSLVVLFLFHKKRRSRVTNHSPDFADDTSGDSNEKSGFKKLFGLGSGAAAAGGAATVDTYNDLEKHLNSRAATSDPFLGGVSGSGTGHDTSDDFAYRGVSNSNNLDSIFHGSGTATGGNSNNGTGGLNSSSASQRGPGHSRVNSDVPRMDTMPEHADDMRQEYEKNFEHMDTSHVRERLSEFEDEDELFFQAHTHVPLLEGENHSNNSRLRFFEEI